MQFHLEQPWAHVKNILMESNPSLTEADLQYKPGSEDEFLESLSRKMDRSKDEVRMWIESASHNTNKAG